MKIEKGNIIKGTDFIGVVASVGSLAGYKTVVVSTEDTVGTDCESFFVLSDSGESKINAKIGWATKGAAMLLLEEV